MYVSSSEILDAQYPEPYPLTELFQCIICEYQSSRKSNLKKHFMIHTKERPFKCYSCTFSAASKNTLKLHVRTHTGEKPYECAVCQRKFSRRNIIKAHVKTHTNDKPFKCSECAFVTARKDNLKFHMRRHLIDKPFQCHMCNSSFIQKCRLKRHLDLHTKMYRCSSCFYQTHLEVNLLKHKLSHYNADIYICFLCGKGIKKKYGLQIHITKRHSLEECRNKIQECKRGNDSVLECDKMYQDKAIATDNTETLCFGNMAQQILMFSPTGCDVTDEILTLQNQADSQVLIGFNSEQQTFDAMYPNVTDDGSSSSDSEVDCVQYPYMQQNILEQNPFQNLQVTNPETEIILNYQPNVNYLVIPSVSLEPTLSTNPSFVLTPTYNNIVNQDFNFVPVCTNTNLLVNNLVPTVMDTSLLLNPTKTVFISNLY